jgi:hypothetical protein
MVQQLGGIRNGATLESGSKATTRTRVRASADVGLDANNFVV